MNRKNMQSYQMLTRTVEFASNHVGWFPKNSAAAEILATMKSGVSELSEKGSARIFSVELTKLSCARRNREFTPIESSGGRKFAVRMTVS